MQIRDWVSVVIYCGVSFEVPSHSKATNKNVRVTNQDLAPGHTYCKKHCDTGHF